MQTLGYVVRPTRPRPQPRLKGLYIFGARDSPRIRSFGTIKAPSGGVLYSAGAQIGAELNERSAASLSDDLDNNSESWYGSHGRVIRSISDGWEMTLTTCRGLIAFDAVLCDGPRHNYYPEPSRKWYEATEAHLQPRVAQFAVGPCAGCQSAPEGIRKYEKTPRPVETCPLLAPPPKHSPTVQAAMRPSSASESSSGMVARCQGKYSSPLPLFPILPHEMINVIELLTICRLRAA